MTTTLLSLQQNSQDLPDSSSKFFVGVGPVSYILFRILVRRRPTSEFYHIIYDSTPDYPFFPSLNHMTTTLIAAIDLDSRLDRKCVGY
jgi:hypothetical protein